MAHFTSCGVYSWYTWGYIEVNLKWPQSILKWEYFMYNLVYEKAVKFIPKKYKISVLKTTLQVYWYTFFFLLNLYLGLLSLACLGISFIFCKRASAQNYFVCVLSSIYFHIKILTWLAMPLFYGAQFQKWWLSVYK